jgi:hypothetical protein
MAWTVLFHRQVRKAIPQLPTLVQAAVVALVSEMEQGGPVRGKWPNYGKLGPTRHHCHLKKGHPTYVAVWVVVDAQQQIIEVTYVGTHEKAPY